MSVNPGAEPPRNLVQRLWSHSAVRYLVVGGVAFVADFAILWLLHEVAGLNVAIAAPIGFLASFVVTYTLQRTIAFTSDARVVPSVARYTALVIANTIATGAIVWAIDTGGGGWVVGKVVAVAATTLWNYFAYRYWVFAKPAEESRSDV
jgi:putative flippase GtrA